jgi:PAS domain S-box-containing protein
MENQFISLELDRLKRDVIIDFLPGIFYVYEYLESGFELIHWNLNHEKVTGYSAAELRGKRVFDFFYPDDFEVIRQGLQEIMENGIVKQVHANLRLKDSSTLPFIFEGYRFHSGNRICFLGVGLDISQYIRAQGELEEARFELARKDRELLGFSINNADLMNLKEELREQLKMMQRLESVDEIKRELFSLENKLKKGLEYQKIWEIFKLRFKEVHHDFFKKLHAAHPSLSKSEMMYLSYLKIKLSSFQIRALLNIGKEAIKKKRYRIRRKMGLRKDIPIESYLEQF